MSIKYRENWVKDFAPKKINGDLGKVFWFAVILSLIFSTVFIGGLFIALHHFEKQTVELQEQSDELDQQILSRLQKLELRKREEQDERRRRKSEDGGEGDEGTGEMGEGNEWTY